MSACLFLDVDAESCKPWAVMGDRETGGDQALFAAINVHHRRARHAATRLLWREPELTRRGNS